MKSKEELDAQYDALMTAINKFMILPKPIAVSENSFLMNGETYNKTKDKIKFKANDEK